MFVTSQECRDVTPQEAESYILGYTIGNDLSCRKFQLPANSGGQFYFAKAFDKFAPIGPTLISPSLFVRNETFNVVTRVNGQVRQTADLKKDMIFSPESILSHMSQGDSIMFSVDFMFASTANHNYRHYHPSRHGGHDWNTCGSWRVSPAQNLPPGW